MKTWLSCGDWAEYSELQGSFCCGLRALSGSRSRQRMKRNLIFWFLLFLAAMSAWLIHYRSSETPTRPNLILISLDTLRSDRIGAYGYQRETTPAIDKFAESSVVFRNAVAASSWTLPSHVTLFSGQYPSTHGVILKNHRIGKETRLLADILSENGYRTFGFTGGGNVGPRHGFSRGFESYWTNPAESRRPRVKQEGFETTLARAGRKIEELNAEPYFLFIHTYDIHCPYNPPEPYYSMFRTSGAEVTSTARCGDESRNPAFGLNQARYMSDRYDGSIRWTDENLGKFLEFLAGRGELEKTIVVITSDHGEEFYEHGGIGHKGTLFRESLMVPLIIHAPGIPARSVEQYVSLVDVLPSLLDLLKIPIPSDVQGTSLTGLISGSGDSSQMRRYQYSELEFNAQLKSFLSNEYHFIRDYQERMDYLFDLGTDPLEQLNLAGTFNDVARWHGHEMEAFAENLSRGSSNTALEMNNEETQALKTLGYID